MSQRSQHFQDADKKSLTKNVKNPTVIAGSKTSKFYITPLKNCPNLTITSDTTWN